MTQLNYFDFFNLPQQYDLDIDVLEQAYFKAQAEYHPDRQRHQPVPKALQAALINDAYETLKSPTKRAFYLLSLHGLVTPLKEEFTVHDPDLLQEIFAFREQMMDEPTLVKVQHLSRDLQQRMQLCSQDLRDAFKNHDWIMAQKHAIKLHYYTKLYSDIKQWQRKHDHGSSPNT